ncbi:MAG TPA: VOC family protein [Catenuloplanes sp.]|jgi:predicted enzyme related to lactoylglutathione lyase
MAVGALTQVHVSVTDIDRAVAFYRDTLGIPLLFEVPGQQMAFLASGPVRLYLGRAERPELATRCMLYFAVDDIDAEHARLVAAGVRAAGEPHPVHRSGTTALWMSFFTDPDGHHVVLTQERADPG